MSIQTTIPNDYEMAIQDLRNLPEVQNKSIMRLVQPQSALVEDGVAKAGEWHIEGVDSSFVPNPLIVSPNRVRFVRKFWMDGLIECSSDDGWTGIGNPGGVCGECTLKDWGIDNERPKCTAGLEFGFWVESISMMVICEFKGSAIKAGNFIANNWRMQTDSGVSETRFSLGVGKREGPNRSTYYVPIPKLV